MHSIGPVCLQKVEGFSWSEVQCRLDNMTYREILSSMSVECDDETVALEE